MRIIVPLIVKLCLLFSPIYILFLYLNDDNDLPPYPNFDHYYWSQQPYNLSCLPEHWFCKELESGQAVSPIPSRLSGFIFDYGEMKLIGKKGRVYIEEQDKQYYSPKAELLYESEIKSLYLKNKRKTLNNDEFHKRETRLKLEEAIKLAKIKKSENELTNEALAKP